MEYYSSIKKDKLLIQTTIWMNLKNIMQSERNQTHDYILYDSMYEMSTKGKSIETESSLVVA